MNKKGWLKVFNYTKIPLIILYVLYVTIYLEMQVSVKIAKKYFAINVFKIFLNARVAEKISDKMDKWIIYIWKIDLLNN